MYTDQLVTGRVAVSQLRWEGTPQHNQRPITGAFDTGSCRGEGVGGWVGWLDNDGKPKGTINAPGLPGR